jgi:hypothetical protein
VIDHNAAYFARALWNPGQGTHAFYEWYSDRLVGGEHGPGLAERLDHIDRSHAWPGYLSDDHVGSIEWAHGHSNEAGAAFNPLDTPDEVLSEFETYLAEISRIAETADAAAAERARYHAAQGRFARLYVDSQRAAARIDEVIERARDEGRKLSAVELAEACERYREMDVAVREAIEVFAGVQTTTADLGVLAALNQKYVTRALWQRHDALREVAPDPDAVPRPDLAPSGAIAPRVFVPVPPESIPSDGAEIVAVVSTPDVNTVSVCSTPLAGGDMTRTPLANQGRGVWRGVLQAGGPVRYWIEADHDSAGTLRAPEAPTATFSAITEVRRGQ